MNTTSTHPFAVRPPIADSLHMTIIENETGRRVCSYPSWLDVSLETCHLEFEEEAWRRAVQERRVEHAQRHRYSVELR